METAATSRKRKSPPLGKRTWTPEDENYLAEKWGYASVPAIAKKLNRTENAVVVRAQRLGLGAVLMAGGYVTLNQLLATVTGRERGNTYQRKSWVENRGLPVHRKKVNRCSFSVVYLEEFWEWAERNRSFLDFSKMEPLALGWEPSWVTEQRKKRLPRLRDPAQGPVDGRRGQPLEDAAQSAQIYMGRTVGDAVSHDWCNPTPMSGSRH